MPLIRLLIAGIISGTLAAASFAADPELVAVGEPGNPGNKVPFGQFGDNAYARGSVPYSYRIGKREVTNAQYCEFLNGYSGPFAESLHSPEMRIEKSADGRFTVSPGAENLPVASVSRAAAAVYCNWLSGAEVYRFRETAVDGKKQLGVVGERDLTSPAASRLYYLPDMHEFYKAGFYDGNGTYRKVTAQNRREPSRSGMEHAADGVSEWMDNRYVETTFALGAADSSPDGDDWNAVKLHKTFQGDAHRFPFIGFRVAATAPVSVAPRLNDDRNFFGPGSARARLRIRSDGEQRNFTLEYAVTDFFNREIRRETVTRDLKNGANDIEFPLPEHDGFFRCRVKLPDGTALAIPFAVVREPVEATPDGNFGVCGHVIRSERGFYREPFPFERIRQCGLGLLRTDTFDRPETAGDAFRRIAASGLRPLAILPNLRTAAEWRPGSPEIVQKWERHGVSPELSGYAESVFRLVEACRDSVDDYELGNEPQWWKIPAEDYAAFAETAAKVVRLADPGARVMLGDIGSLARPILATGVGKEVDLLSVHTYCNYNPNFWGTVGWMRRMNGVKRAAGLPEKRIWITETNICTYSHPQLVPLESPEEALQYQALYIPKAMTGLLAYGAEKVFLYAIQDPPLDSREEHFGLIDRHGLPKGAFMSCRLTAGLLGRAKFSGFLKGHSLAIGKISALGFETPEKRQVAVLWRNDAYSYGTFKQPFASLIGQSVPYRIPGKGTAELFTLDGEKRLVAAKNGVFEVPVDEAPCFLRGELEFEFQPEETALHIPPMVFPEAAVRILPDVENTKNALDLMGGYELTATGGAETTIRVRVHNLTGRKLEGRLQLISPESWRSFGWKISPEEAAVSIPPRSFTTVTFGAAVPPEFSGETGLELKAVFVYDGNRIAADKITVRPQPNIVPAQWHTPGAGWSLLPAANGEGIKLAWSGEHRYGGLAFLRAPRPFARRPDELKRKIAVDFKSDVRIQAVAVLFEDASKEVFLLHRRLPKPDRTGKMTFDCGDLSREGGFVCYGGDGNKQIDFPLKLQGFAFDPVREDSARKTGEIVISGYEVSPVGE